MADTPDIKFTLDELKRIAEKLALNPSLTKSTAKTINNAIAIIDRQSTHIALYGQNMRQIGVLWGDTLYRNEPSDFDKKWCASKGEVFVPVFVAETRNIDQIVPQDAINSASTIVDAYNHKVSPCEYWKPKQSNSLSPDWTSSCGHIINGGLRDYCSRCGGKITIIENPENSDAN